MLRVAICEDCPLQTEIIQKLLEKYKLERPEIELRIHSFCSGHEILHCVDTRHSFDLFLLDILIPGQSGIDIAHELRKRDTDATLIFLTSTSDYLMEAFGVWATQYVLKPITENKLFPVLDKIIPTIKPQNERNFILSTPGKIVYVPFESIVYAELARRVIQINQISGQTLHSSSIRTPFAEAVAPLIKDYRFLHPHNSFVINMTHVQELAHSFFIMKNGVHVPVPKHKYATAKKKYLAFLFDRDAGVKNL